MFILRHKTPNMTPFRLNKTKWSNLRKASLVADLSQLTKVDVKVLGRLRKAFSLSYSSLLRLTGPNENHDLREKRTLA